MLAVIDAKRRALRDDKENLDITNDFALEPSRANHTRRLRKRGQETEAGSKNSKRKANAPPNPKWQAPDADALDDLSSIRKVTQTHHTLPTLLSHFLHTPFFFVCSLTLRTFVPFLPSSPPPSPWILGGSIWCNKKVGHRQEKVVTKSIVDNSLHCVGAIQFFYNTEFLPLFILLILFALCCIVRLARRSFSSWQVGGSTVHHHRHPPIP